MDEGGSMQPYTKLCNRLFSAVHKSTHFKDVRFYYFHNCIYDALYDNSRDDNTRSLIKTQDILNQFDSDYKVIIVGDAAMAPYELLFPHGIITWEDSNEEMGLTWLQRVAKKFPYSVWLNPLQKEVWEAPEISNTIPYVRDVFPMYELTLAGLDQAIKKLMVRR